MPSWLTGGSANWCDCARPSRACHPTGCDEADDSVKDVEGLQHGVPVGDHRTQMSGVVT